MTERDEIIGAAGSTPAMRYVNFLLYQMSQALPACVTLSGNAALPEVLDLESNTPVSTDFQSVRQRLVQIAGSEGSIPLTMCGKPYAVQVTSPDDVTTVVEMTK